MKLFATTALSLFLAGSASAQAAQTTPPAGASGTNGAARDMTVIRAGTQASSQGPARNFTGSVRVDPLFPAHPPSNTSGACVTFEPGARSAWHTHPQGQVLVVTAGVGRVRQWGGQVQEIRPGDVIWTRPASSTGTAPHQAPP